MCHSWPTMEQLHSQLQCNIQTMLTITYPHPAHHRGAQSMQSNAKKCTSQANHAVCGKTQPIMYMVSLHVLSAYPTILGCISDATKGLKNCWNVSPLCSTGLAVQAKTWSVPSLHWQACRRSWTSSSSLPVCAITTRSLTCATLLQVTTSYTELCTWCHAAESNSPQ